MTDKRTWHFGPFRFDGRLLWRGAELLGIAERDAHVLKRLLDNHQTLVPRHELLTIYGTHAEPSCLDTAISRLRGHFDDRSDDRGRGKAKARRHAYIETVQGEGYVFVYDPVRIERPRCSDCLTDYEVGLQLWNDREPDSLWKAKGCFDDAVKCDPRFGAAYAARADCFAILGSYWWTPPLEAAARAKAAATQALRMDADLAQPHATLGFVKSLFERNWSDAARDFEESIDRAPDYATAHHWYALHLAALDEPVRALEEITTAWSCDPNSRIIEAHAAAIAYWSRDFDAAEQQCGRAIEYNPRFWYAHHLLGVVYEQRERFEDALRKQHDAANLVAGPCPMLTAARARAYALCGARLDAERELETLSAVPRNRAALFHTATAYAALNDADRAFECLRAALDQSDVWASFLAVDARLDSLRMDGRFATLLTRLQSPHG